jgi:uncharacterized protein YxjI
VLSCREKSAEPERPCGDEGTHPHHEHTHTDGRTPVATVTRKWFRMTDTYGVDIDPDQDAAIVPATTVAVDVRAHEGR